MSTKYKIIPPERNSSPPLNHVHNPLNDVHPTPEPRSPELTIELANELRGKEPPSAAQTKKSVVRKFPKEVQAQIKLVQDQIQKLKDFGTDKDRPRIRALIERRKELEEELVEL